MEILQEVIQNLRERNNEIIAEFREIRDRPSMFLSFNPINRSSVDVVHNFINSSLKTLQKKFKKNGNNLDVIVDSYGGDADAAYHIAKIFHNNFSGELSYIIPRFDKRKLE
jgi:hypothetical protein